MSLVQDDIDHIEQIVRKLVTDLTRSRSLKHQRELMREGFNRMDKRFEQVDKRFEQVDKRFEQMQLEMNKRFEQVDKRFEQMTARIDRFMIWSFATTVSVGGVVIAVIKLT